MVRLRHTAQTMSETAMYENGSPVAALMLREGYEVAFQPVNHRHRESGVSKYTNFGRLKASVSDLLGVMWLQSRARNPQGVDEA